MRYGLPYMGSKNKIASKIISILPAANNFYDLFCGGCAVTHAAMCSNKYKVFFINDIQPDLPRFFYDAVCTDKYFQDYYKKSIHKLDFYTKRTDPFFRFVWSFSSNLSDYIYGDRYEEIKTTIHDMLISDSFEERYSKYLKFILLLEKNEVDIHSLENIQSLHNLKNVHFLHNNNNNNNNMKLSSLSYDCVPILSDSVVYADPPYRNTQSYIDQNFDHDAFYDWLRNTSFPVWVSEFNMPEDFVKIAKFQRQSYNSQVVADSLFLHQRFCRKTIQPDLFS